MLSIENNSLRFNFTDLHPNATCTVEFQRTLRIPDDGNKHPLPPGLGGYPLHHIDDYADRIPDQWHRRGGVMMPMYQSEALWLNFNSSGYPFACKVAAGKINAVTGEIWQDHLNTDPQDYMVVPDQPWLDGFCVDKGSIRQFVAMPLGEGSLPPFPGSRRRISRSNQCGGIPSSPVQPPVPGPGRTSACRMRIRSSLADSLPSFSRLRNVSIMAIRSSASPNCARLVRNRRPSCRRRA